MTYQKQEVLAEKCPPPGKPVTFYECHPEDHAPAPSVRADFSAWRLRDIACFDNEFTATASMAFGTTIRC